jgi:hypothetical protein
LVTNRETSEAETRLAALEAELQRERAAALAVRRRLEVKERELVEIHRSRAWGAIASLRTFKHRRVDPLLALFGIHWPPRRCAPETDGEPFAVPQAMPGRHDLICFSTCEWDSRFQRPQQLLSLFAAAGHRVFYVSQRFRRGGPPFAVAPKRANVYEVTLRGEPLDVYAQGLDGRGTAALMEGLASLRAEAALGPTAAIVDLPFWWPLARAAREAFGWPVIYDCMDDHAGFPTVRRAMASQEEELLAAADVVLASSAPLQQKALARRSEAVLLRNGCDFDHFAATPNQENGRPTIGYYGAIADWFDTELVTGLARRRPDWDFLLVGSTYGAAVGALARLPNVSLPGEEPYQSLPEWLGRFDVAIIPFKRNRLTEATNPVKVYEILAAGKPIVSVPIPEVALLAPLVRLASTAEEFEREIAASLIADHHAAEERRTFARANRWQDRFEVLRAVVQSTLG